MEPLRRLEELRKLLCDVTMYLKNELNAHDYENSTKDNFGGSRQLECRSLLDRCEGALSRLEEASGSPGDPPQPESQGNCTPGDHESSYLDMTAKGPSDYVDVNAPFESDPEDCDLKKSTKDDYREIYDVCRVSLQRTTRSLEEAAEALDCPYAGLPASHLTSIEKSPKRGYLFRLERRLFFDQSKKFYCGIVADWMLCYSDGMTGIRPTFCLSLNGVEVEHHGEGKRRDLCFQITDFEGTKKIIFEAKSEIDAKEWIHAIEAAIRGDMGDATKKMGGIGNALRKLPTPPVQNKIYRKPDCLNDGIYEEPLSLYVQLREGEEEQKREDEEQERDEEESEELQPIGDIDETAKKPPTLPVKGRTKITVGGTSPAEYDVPKITERTPSRRSCPGAGPTVESPEELLARTKSEFQTRVKDVHIKLTNQLSSGGKIMNKKSPQRGTGQSLKTVKMQLFKDKVTSHQSNEAPPSPATTTPMKKWFLNRLNKSTSPDKKRFGHGEKEKENLLNSDSAGSDALQDLKSPKKGKVNMIINQLEANGHLPIFTKNLERFPDSGDDYNYEPIVTMGNF